MTNLHDARVTAAAEAIYDGAVGWADLSMGDCESFATRAILTDDA